MNLRKIVSATVIALTTIGAAQAEVVPNRWEKMEALAAGTAVIVSLQGGELLECAFNKTGPDDISLKEMNGQERRLPKSAVLKIETVAVARDRLRNGTLIGALIGAAGGLAGIIAFANSTTNGSVYWGDEDGAAYLLGGVLVGGGIGAATGAIIDAFIKHREVLYRAR